MDKLRTIVDNISSSSRRVLSRLKLNRTAGSVDEGYDGDKTCCICLSNISNIACLQPCGHEFDLSCIVKWTQAKNTCPFCRSICHKVQYKFERTKNMYKKEKRIISPPVLIDFDQLRNAFMTDSLLDQSPEMDDLLMTTSHGGGTTDDLSVTIMLSVNRDRLQTSRYRHQLSASAQEQLYPPYLLW